MSRYGRLVSKPVPQSEPLDTRQVKNHAGGFVYEVDDWTRLERFLILGSDAPTYYQAARDLTRENASCVERCWAKDPILTVATVSAVSTSGRAPKNDPAIFALALGAVSKDVKVRQYALGGIHNVCRTSTHLFMFVDMCRELGRGWGRALKDAVAEWYLVRNPASLAYQMVKYRAREGYSHKRMLQLSHPKIARKEVEKAALFNWVCGKPYDVEHMPPIARAHLDAMASTNPDEWAYHAKEYHLPWEALPTEALPHPKVWEAMLPDMGLMALVRNLSTMTRNGLIGPFSAATKMVVDRLGDGEEIRHARLHPFNLLNTLAVYRSGHAFRGSTTWTPVPQVVDALDGAFYEAFKHVMPSGKRTLIGLDVSGSMSNTMNDSALWVSEAAAAMAMVTMRTESQWHVFGFDTAFRDLGLTAKMSLSDVCQKTGGLSFGSTDCALPMVHALKEKWEVDVFYVLTDYETWFGRIHPMEALRDYRKKTGIPAKLVVAGMTSTGFSIADPEDSGCLDVVGFDTDAPSVIADFVRDPLLVEHPESKAGPHGKGGPGDFNYMSMTN